MAAEEIDAAGFDWAALTARPTGTTTRSVTVVANQSPTASFTSSANKSTLSVDGSGSSDPDGTIASYDWDWGDGSAHGSGATATHNYASPGSYSAVDHTVETDLISYRFTVEVGVRINPAD